MSKYWEDRGNIYYEYKGEEYYTITPIPYYAKRREILLNKIDNIIYRLIESDKTLKICDFGCGNGYLTCHIALKFPKCEIIGIDISKSMINKAKERTGVLKVNNLSFQVLKDISMIENKFDVILIVAVLQHVIDYRKVRSLVLSIYDKINKSGKVLVFEATSETQRTGNTWIRRVESDYVKIFKENNFKLLNRELIAFPFFNIYELRILGILKKFIKGNSIQKCMVINKNKFFIILNEFMINISIFFDRFMKPKKGNTLFVFQKMNNKL